MISSKFTKSFRGTGDLVVFYDFQVIFRSFSDIEKNHQAAWANQVPEACLKSPDGVLIEF